MSAQEERERRVKEALRADAPLRANPDFRARLKQSFVSGEIARDAPPEPAPVVAMSGTDRWINRFAPLAAAAVLLLTLVPTSLETGYRMLRGDAAGTWTLDGITRPLSELSSDSLLPAGAEVQVEAGAIEVAWDDMLAVRVNPGRLVLPDPLAAEGLRGAVREGEAIFLTGPGFAGRDLVITTPEGRVEVVGTAFAVWCDAEVTCVCVLEGHASVGVNSADLEPVSPGKRKVMFADGSDPEILDIMPEHRSGLLDFAERTRTVLGR